MPGDKDKLKKLHDNLIKDGYDLPDYATFEKDMASPEKLTKLHATLIKDGYDLPDYDTFSSDMGYGVKKKQNSGGASLSDVGTAISETGAEATFTKGSWWDQSVNEKPPAQKEDITTGLTPTGKSQFPIEEKPAKFKDVLYPVNIGHDVVQGAATDVAEKIATPTQPVTHSDDPVKDLLKQTKEKQAKADAEFAPYLHDDFFKSGESTKQQTAGGRIGFDNKWRDYLQKNKEVAAATLNSVAVHNFLENNVFKNGIDAKGYIEKTVKDGGKDLQNNETFQLAQKKAGEYDRTVSEIESSNSLEDYFFNKYRQANPHFDEQMKLLEQMHPNEFANGLLVPREMTGNAKMGQIVAMGLQDQNIRAYVENQGVNKFGGIKNLYEDEFYHLSNNVLTEFPDFGVNVVANEISRKRQELKKNSYIADFDDGAFQRVTDKIAEDLYKNNPTKKAIYDEVVGKDLKKYIDVPGFFNRLSGGIDKTLSGIKSTFTNSTIEEDVKESINKEATQVSAGEKGAYKIVGEVGDMGGFLMAMAATGNAAKGLFGFTAGLSGTTVPTAFVDKAVTASTFLGESIKQGHANYPLEPNKALLSGYLNTAAFVAASNLLPHGKIADVVAAGKNDFAKLLDAISDESITAAAKKELASSWFKNSLEASGMFAKQYGKSLAEILAITNFQQSMDKMLGMEKGLYAQVYPASKDEDVLKVFAVGNLVPSAFAAYHDYKYRNFTKDAIWDVANSPRRFAKTMYENGAFDGMSKEQSAEVLGRITLLNKVKGSLDDQGMPDSKQKSYLLHTANEMVLEKQAAEAKAKAADQGEPVLKGKEEEKVTEVQKLIGDSQKIKEDIIEGKPVDDPDRLPQDDLPKEPDADKAADVIDTTPAPEEKKLTAKEEAVNFIKEVVVNHDELPLLDKISLQSAKDDPEGFLKQTAMQANNINQDGDFNSQYDASASIKRTFGPEIIKAANDAFPRFQKLREKALKEIRDTEIKKRKNEFGPPDKEQQRVNDFVNDVEKYNNLPNGNLGKLKSNGLQERNRLAIEAKKLGATFSTDKRQHIYTDAKAVDKTNSNQAIDPTYKPIAERGEKLNDLWNNFDDILLDQNYNASQIIPNDIVGADGKRLNAGQFAKALDDVTKNIPSKGANLVLNGLEKMAEQGFVEIRDGQNTVAVPIEEYLNQWRNHGDPAEKPLSDNDLDGWTPADIDESDLFTKFTGDANGTGKNIKPTQNVSKNERPESPAESGGSEVRPDQKEAVGSGGRDQEKIEGARKELDDIFGNGAAPVVEEQLTFDFNNPSHGTTEIKAEGKNEKVQYESIAPAGDYSGDSDLQQKDAAGKQTDYDRRTIEQVWSETKFINFTGSNQVKSAADVAHIMRLLETKSVEHFFAVHIDETGNSHIQFISIGGITGTVVDPRLVMAGVSRFGSKKVYLVHNHPSGSMQPSRPDRKLSDDIGKVINEMDGVEWEHVIMDTYKETYVLMDKFGDEVRTREKMPQENDQSLTVHLLDGMKSLTKPLGKIADSKSVAEIIYNFRFSVLPKAGMLITDRENKVIGNYVFKGDFEPSELLNNFSGHATATGIVLYGNQPVSDVKLRIHKLQELLKATSTVLLDYVNIVGGDSDVKGAYEYISAADEGDLFSETQAEYNTNKLTNPDTATQLKNAQNQLRAAQKKLSDAEDKIAKTQSSQGAMFDAAKQGSMFGVQRDEAKEILDPLRVKVKEAKAIVGQLQVKLEGEDKQAKGQTSLFEPEVEYGDRASKIDEWVKRQKKNGLSDEQISKLLQGRADMTSKEADDYVDQFNTGVHADNTPREETSDKTLKPVEFPEMVQLARAIASGKYPEVKKLADALGYFSPRLKKIVLSRKLFDTANYEDLEKTIAHEIGHFIDFLPDETMARGNILGRIASLRDFMRKFLPEYPGGPGELTDEDKKAIEAEEKANHEIKMVEIDEIIEKITGLTPEDVLDMFRDSVAGINNPALLDYIQRLSTKEKKRIVLAAMKGQLADDLDEGWKKRAKDRIAEEIKNRKLWEEKKIFDETYNLSKQWRPFDEETASPSDLSYRKSSAEIYADMISVLFNSPGTLEKKAPMFFHAFMNYLESKPSFKAVYDDLMKLLTDPESVKAEREKNTVEGYRKAEQKRAEVLKIQKKNESVKAKLGRELFTSFTPLLHNMDRSKTGSDLSQYERTRNAVEQMEMWKSKAALLLDNYEKKSVNPLTEQDVSLDDVGQIVQFTRNISPARKDKANPLGLQTDEQNYNQIQRVLDKYSDEQIDAIGRALKNFYENGFDVIQDAYDNGLLSRAQMDEAEKNKYNYATFKPVKYIDEAIQSAKMFGIVGGLGEIANPYLETMTKMVMIQRAAVKNKAILISRDELKKADPESVKDTRLDYRGRPKDKLKPNQDYVYYKEGGVTKVFITDKYIADVFKTEPPEKVFWAIQLLGALAKPFRLAWTKYNPGFIFITNPIKDSKRSIKNTLAILAANGALQKRDFVKLHGEYAAAWWGSYYDTKSFFNHKPTETAKRMLEHAAVNPESALFAGFDANYNGTANFLSHYNFLKPHLGITKTKRFLDDVKHVIEYIPEQLLAKPGSHIEMRTKVAMFKILEKHLGTEAAAYYTRNFVGTPNFSERFAGKKYLSWIPFTSVILQGLRNDIQIASSPKTAGAYWLYVGLTTVIPGLLIAAAKMGMFDSDDEPEGERLSDWFKKAGQYNRQNYMLIPLGFTDNGKAKGIKIPLDDVESFVWNNIQNLTEDKSVKDKLRGVVNSVTNRLPDYGAGTDLVSKWWQYGVKNENPYDDFRKRNLISDRNFTIGGKGAFMDMLKWSANKFGIRLPQHDDGTMTKREQVVSMLPALRRLYFETNIGEYEEIKKVQEEVDRDAAIRMDNIDQALNSSLNEQTDAVERGGEVDMRKLIFDAYKRYAGKDRPETEQDGKDIQTIVQKATVLLKKDNVKSHAQSAKEKMYANQIINAQSNTAKKAIVDLYKEDASADEFKEFVQFLKDNQIYVYRPE